VVLSARFARFLSRHSTIGLDTSILIYLVQDHPRYGDLCTALLGRIEEGGCRGVTSVISFLEALVQPYRLEDDELTQKFYALLSTYPGLRWAPVTLEVADQAAELRARYRFGTPDAIQIATAVALGATGFVGNDRALRKVREIECVTLDEFLGSR
jgi:predicted nucleic acid-binding protein